MRELQSWHALNISGWGALNTYQMDSLCSIASDQKHLCCHKLKYKIFIVYSVQGVKVNFYPDISVRDGNSGERRGLAGKDAEG